MQPEYDLLLQQIVDHFHHPRPLSASARPLARQALLDALGCALAAQGDGPCRRVLEGMAFTRGQPLGTPIPGSRDVLGPVEAAFHIGTAIRWLEFNDTWLAREWGHPSDNLGAILAVADWVSRTRQAEGQPALTMATVLDTLVRAYEVHGVLCLDNCFNTLGIDHVIFVKVVSAAAASHLLGLDRQQSLSAVSNAFIDGHPLRTYRHAPNAGTRKSWAAGDATARGVQLALLSRAGEMGYPSALSVPTWGFNDAVYHGQSLRLGRELGEYVIQNILYKVPNPAEYHAQTAVEAAIHLHHRLREEGLETGDIERIDLLTQAPALRIIDKQGPLNNPADRDHCLQYMVAVALLTGDLKVQDFDDPMAANADVQNLRTRMHCREHPDYTANYYDPDKRSIGNSVTLHLRHRPEPLSHAIEYPLGHRLRRAECLPLLLAKFRSNAATCYAPAQIDRVQALIIDSKAFEDLPVPAFMSALC